MADPIAELDPAFSSPDATPTPWSEAVARLEAAEIYWLSTVRPDGRPHVTPLIAVWLDGAPHLTTGPTERKARNLEANQACVLTTGCNELGAGLDVVVEGEAVPVTDTPTLRRVGRRLRRQVSGAVPLRGPRRRVRGRWRDRAGIRDQADEGVRLRPRGHLQPDPLAVQRSLIRATAGR